MAKIKPIKSGYAGTSNGSIDYQYYDQRARNLRSGSVWKLLKGFFTDKKNSRIDDPEDCDVVAFNCTDEHKRQFNSLKEAA